MFGNTVRLALFQPDIAANTGTILRMCACFGVPADIIEPCGFPFSDRSLKRSGMDYLDRAEIVRHASWTAFLAQRRGRIVLMTTKAGTPHSRFRFEDGDTLMLGRESAGAPDNVHATADARICIPMAAGERSLNVALAAAIGLGEALRQTRPDWT
jgi:tRNA (cytidine/uridine-2'-O-)-methyltransferase